MYPYLFQMAVEYKLDAKKNVLIHTKSPSPSTPYTPNPDLIYSIGFYDLSNGELQLSGDIPMDLAYFSIAFYESNTSHFAILKKDIFKRPHFQIALTQNKSLPIDKETVRVVSPTKSGTIIIRYYSRDKKEVGEIAKIQKSTRLFVNKQ
jgi:uncharacterized membrane protein